MKRQLAAILYADVAGYSRLTGLDEEETHRKLDAGLNLLTDVIAAHGGVKVHEAGDAILAEFQSATSAVNSAVEFQRQMATRNAQLAEHERLEFRVGVNLGEVIRDRDDIYGDGVNLAARIQELADPGGVCISGTVYEQVAGKVDQAFDDLGHRKVKNIAHSIHVYRVRLSDMPTGVETQPFFDFDNKTIDRSSLINGRCLCGDVHYEISEPAIATGFCHCRMCQRAHGAPVSAWAAFRAEAVRFTKGEPKYYKSSLIAERGFCANCGSSLTTRYYAPEWAEYTGIKTATLDNPEDFAPTCHLGIESQLPWLDIHDDLPRTRSEDSPELRKRWDAVGAPNPADWT
jgi:adenylate cyclase